MNWTEQQKKAIETTGQDILVSAAAGSGKTAVLTERIRRLVMEERIPVDRLLVVTFSQAAASEMREKILRALSGAIREHPDDASWLKDQVRRARTADISTFHRFAMNVIRRYFYLTEVDPNFTICDDSRRDILEQQALDELLEARFQEGTETKDEEAEKDGAEPDAGRPADIGVVRMNDAGWDGNGEPAEERPERPEDSGSAGAVGEAYTFTGFLRHYSSVRSEQPVRDMILEVYHFILSMPDPFEWLHESVQALSGGTEAFLQSAMGQTLTDRFYGELKEIEAILEQVCEEVSGLTGLEARALEDLEHIRTIRERLERAEEHPFTETIRTELEYKFQTFRAKKEEKEAYEAVRELVKKRRDVAKKKLKTIREDLTGVSLEEAVERMQATWPAAVYLEGLVLEFHRRFQEKKAEKRVLDFNDLEHTALQILRNPEVADQYKARFEAIFIDEYQDSSVLQETLIQCISRGNNVYMVGDVKQSIYKFRLAEPEIFIDKYNDFREGRRPGIRIDLNRNFRSKGSILQAVNGIFSGVMSRSSGGIDYDEDAALKKGSAYEGELDHPVSFHLIDSSAEEEDLDPDNAVDAAILELKSTELEAFITARLIAERLGMRNGSSRSSGKPQKAGQVQWIHDDKKGVDRPVRQGDIVILLRSVRGSAEIYAEALKDFGIPSYTDAGEGYFETTEIEVFLNLLRVIDNRRKDLPLISVLRSPVFRFSVDDLVRIRLFHREVAYHQAFLECAALAGEAQGGVGVPEEDAILPLARKCLDASQRLLQWRQDARHMPLEEFLWNLMRETAYYDYVMALPGGERRAANLRMLIDRAVSFSTTQRKGLFGFIQYIEAVGRSRVPVGQSMQAGDAENMVRIMTIHKSKGLEFPVVILAGMGKHFRHDAGSGQILMHRELGLALQYKDPERHVTARTLGQNVIAARKRKEHLDEEMRILYVAMTRAMDELVMVGTFRSPDQKLELYESGLGPTPGAAGGFMDWIGPNLARAGIRMHRHDRVSAAGTRREETGHSVRLDQELTSGFPSFQDRDGLLAILQERFSYQYPFSDDVASKSKFSVSELNRLLHGAGSPGMARSGMQAGDSVAADVEEADSWLLRYEEEYAEAFESVPEPVLQESCTSLVPGFLREEEEVTPMHRGTAVHKILELIPFRTDNEEERIRRFAIELVDRGILTAQEAKSVNEAGIAAFFASPIGRRACEADWLRREWAFTLRKSRDEVVAVAENPETAARLSAELPPRLLIQGIIDCCFRDADGLTVLDYKTDRVSGRNGAERRKNAENIVRSYRHQIAMYAEVLEKAFDEPVHMAGIFLLDCGEFYRI